jgi:hypothetical protein
MLQLPRRQPSWVSTIILQCMIKPS